MGNENEGWICIRSRERESESKRREADDEPSLELVHFGGSAIPDAERRHRVRGMHLFQPIKRVGFGSESSFFGGSALLKKIYIFVVDCLMIIVGDVNMYLVKLIH